MALGNVGIVCFTASYLVAFGLEWTRLIGKRSISQPIMLLFGLAGFVAHTMYLLERATQAHLPPLLSSTHDWLLVLAWLAILFYLFLSALQRDLPVGMFLLPLVLMLIGAAYVVGDVPSALHARDQQLEDDALRHWGMLHASLLVFGMAGVILGFVLSMMYLVQHRRLKHKQTMYVGMALPSLARLARLNWWAIVVSVPLLTLGMLTGVRLIFLSKSAPDPISWGDPIVVASGVVWLVMMAFFCWLLWTPRPAGKQVAWLTIWAFGFLLATFLGLQMLTGGHETTTTGAQRKHGTAKKDTAPINTVQHNTVQHNTAQLNTVQFNTAGTTILSPLAPRGRGAGGEGADRIPTSATTHWRTSREWHLVCLDSESIASATQHDHARGLP